MIVLNGRMAGKKGLIVKTFDEGTDGRKYGHAIIAGIARAPLKVKKSMNEKKVEKRSRVKPFLKLVNFNHLMPTRCVSCFCVLVLQQVQKLVLRHPCPRVSFLVHTLYASLSDSRSSEGCWPLTTL